MFPVQSPRSRHAQLRYEKSGIYSSRQYRSIFIHIQPRSASPDRTLATCDSGHVPRCSALRGKRGRSSWVRDGDRDQRDRSCTCGASLGPHPVAQACVERKQAGSGFRLLRRLLPYSASGPAHPSSILKLAASPPQGKLRPPASLSHSQAFGPHAGRPSAGACVQFQRGGLLQYASILTEAHTAARAWAPRAAQRAASSWGAGE